MTSAGRDLRFSRLLHPKTSRSVIVPMDHGAYFGPLSGIEVIEETIEKADRGGAEALLLNRGIFKIAKLYKYSRLGFILRVSGSSTLSSDFPYETSVASVEEALRLGADAVAFTVNVGSEGDVRALHLLGRVADACDRWSVPLLAEMLPAGQGVHDPFSVEHVSQVARMGAELGADIIKTNYTGSVETFRQVVQTCPVPIVIAGGPKKSGIRDVLEMVKGAVDAGGLGVCIGRNIWQYEDPVKMTRVIHKIVHDGLNVEAALKQLLT